MQLRLVFIFASFLSGCVVKLSNETPGAQGSCNQEASVIQSFYCTTFQGSIANASPQACTSCHISGAAGGNAMQFTLPGFSCCSSSSCSTDIAVQSNFCTAYLKGKKLYEYPQSSAHSSGVGAVQFSQSQVQGLIDWVGSLQ
jgi:hypothetical protein